MFTHNLVVRLAGTHHYYKLGKRILPHRPHAGEVLVYEFGDVSLHGDCETLVQHSQQASDGEVLPIVIVDIWESEYALYRSLTVHAPRYMLGENYV